ncbi:MAG: pyruvate, phosphate dikinase [Chloroflexi bacterium]|nr:pyruvate, phosphate dikinase [Chloroflexota bacterium]
MSSKYVLPLNDSNATLETVGGKGMSLAKLARAGLPVPDGFHITTEAYRQFVAVNDLQMKILSTLKDLDTADPATLEAASASIGGFFADGTIPAEIATAITSAYLGLNNRQSTIENRKSVAVRSSATAEDLPGASFAGQQETYLNIRGEKAVLEAVRKCWASLWTARAIAYRARQNIAPDAVALAVVVQELVFADAAGIMFTANPLDGERSEVVINAAWGLGEAIVSGAVTPDTMVVNKKKMRINRRETAEKLVMTVRTESGVSEEAVPNHLRKKEVLSKAQVLALTKYGMQIESLYQMPMDIEWTLANGKFAIVQARPITSLPPEWKRVDPKVMYARGSFAEFVPDAVSPLFATLGVPIAKESTLKLMNDVLEKEIPDCYHFDVINGYIYVGVPMTWEVMVPFIGATLKMSKILKTSDERWKAARGRLYEEAKRWRETDLSALTAAQLLEGARRTFRVTAEAYNVAQSGTIPNATSSEMSFCKFYDTLVKRKGDPDGPTLLFGLDNQPLRAEKALFDIATWLRGQPSLVESIQRKSGEEIVKMMDNPGWDEFHSRLDAYLQEFGHAIYDLDFARPLPIEEPAPLVDAIRAYLAGTGGNPYQRQQEADARRKKIIAEATRRLDPLRRRWFLKLLKWATETAPQREDSIADLGLCHPQIRRLLGEVGCRLVEQNVIESAQDVYWLQADELDALAAKLDRGEALENQVEKVNEHKAEWQFHRRLTPPPFIPKDAWFSIFMPHGIQHGDTLKGFAASAGKVTAKACVMLGPEDFNKMKQGDVLVAVTTTPAWTPLFTMASAVVTDIGGPLSHSSIVAREYGIPAVLATGNATRRIQDGQTVTVDGGAGTVELK